MYNNIGEGDLSFVVESGMALSCGMAWKPCPTDTLICGMAWKPSPTKYINMWGDFIG